MQIYRPHLFFLCLFFIFSSCLEEPNFDIYPTVSIQDYYLTIDEAGVDALFVNIDYTDGDGDLGLSEELRKRRPYHNFDVVFYQGRPIEKNTHLGDSLFPQNFKRSDDGTALTWASVEVGRDVFKTYLVQRNYNHYNLFIDFYIKKDGQYTFYDFEALGGSHFYRAFPVLKNTDSKVNSIQGNMVYKIPRIKNFFKFDTLKIKIYIKDRALNKSNVAETGDFILGDILR